MKTLHLLFSSLLFIFSPCVICAWQTRDSLVLTQSETLRYATLVNDYFMRTYPDVGAKSYVGGEFAHDGKLVIPVPDTEAGM